MPSALLVYEHRVFHSVLVSFQPLGNQLMMRRCGQYAMWLAWPR